MFETGAYYRTVNLADVTGLTFIFAPTGHLSFVHGHSDQAPVVHVPPEVTRTKKEQAELRWLFIPLPRGDSVTFIASQGEDDREHLPRSSMGLREPVRYLVRVTLAESNKNMNLTLSAIHRSRPSFPVT